MARRIKHFLQNGGGIDPSNVVGGNQTTLGDITGGNNPSSFSAGLVDPNASAGVNLLNAPPTGGFQRPSFASRVLTGLGKGAKVAGQVGEVALPFLTYLENQRLINETPGVEPPLLVPNANLKTDLNFDPQVKELQEVQRAGVKGAQQNIVDPSVQANIALAGATGTQREVNKIRSEEQNKELLLENRKSTLDLRQSNIRTGQVNQFQDDVRANELDIQGKRSQNASLLVDTLQTVIRDKRVDRNDRLGFVMMARALDTDGVITRNLAEAIQESEPELWQQFLDAGGKVEDA